MKRPLFTAVVAALATLAAPAAARADFVLDTFDSPSPGQFYQIALLNPSPTYTSPTTTVSPGVSRSILVSVAAPLPPDPNSVSGTIGGGLFTMDTNNASAVTSQVTYALTGAAGNLTGASGLELAFKNFDAGTATSGTPVTVELLTATGTLTGTATIAESASPFAVTVGSFTGTGDLSQVNSIRVTINGGASPQTAVDFALDEVRVRAVPAPPALLLAGIGLAGLVGRARFRRATA